MCCAVAKARRPLHVSANSAEPTWQDTEMVAHTLPEEAQGKEYKRHLVLAVDNLSVSA